MGKEYADFGTMSGTRRSDDRVASVFTGWSGACSPILSAVLDASESMVMLIDRDRRIVFANDTMLRAAGVENLEQITGLRHGAAVRCLHAEVDSGGCGESDFCRACGIARVIASRFESEGKAQAEVLLSVQQGDKVVAREYAVTAVPVEHEDAQHTVVAFRDISNEKRRDALEQVFFHDILNTITCLAGYTDLLKRDGESSAEILDHIVYLGERLKREVLDQRALLEAERGTLNLQLRPVDPDEVLSAAERLFTGHLLLKDQVLDVSYDGAGQNIVTDFTLLLRVVINMVKNAFEATRREDPVRLWAERDATGCTFKVHNHGSIPPDVARQIFKRSFSTKAAKGRGLGTYSMKLFGERYLGGKVGFSSSAAEGTTFYVVLPLEQLEPVEGALPDTPLAPLT
jgi:signal transduction histidine kinase